MLDTLEPHRQQILCLVFRHNVNVNFGIKKARHRQLSWHTSHLQLGITRGFLLIALSENCVKLCLSMFDLMIPLSPLYSSDQLYMCTLTRGGPGDGQWRAERSLVNFDWTHSASNILITWEMGYIRSRYDYLEQSWVNVSWGGIIFISIHALPLLLYTK